MLNPVKITVDQLDELLVLREKYELEFNGSRLSTRIGILSEIRAHLEFLWKMDGQRDFRNYDALYLPTGKDGTTPDHSVFESLFFLEDGEDRPSPPPL